MPLLLFRAELELCQGPEVSVELSHSHTAPEGSAQTVTWTPCPRGHSVVKLAMKPVNSWIGLLCRVPSGFGEFNWNDGL